MSSLIDSTLNIQQIQSTKVDSICETTTRIISGQQLLHGEVESTHGLLQEITAYGVAFSDTASVIAIPLIIALFAFAFTYLFSVITRINEKYGSEAISNMFKTSSAYRCYMWGSAISVGFIILVGFLSLLMTGAAHSAFTTVMNLGCLAVAGLYAGIILWFVHTCLEYDDHQKMLGLIEARYQKERSKTWALNIRTQRLTALCLYADKNQNADLLASVMNRVNDLDKVERLEKKRNTPFYTMSFYENIVDSYIQSPHTSEAERSLLWYWSRSFRHDQLPYTGYFYSMLGKMVEAVKRGRISLFAAFMDNCWLRYDYINQIPRVAYSKGAGVEEQEKVEKEGLDIWQELRGVHFLAAAHLFTLGYYEVAGVLRKGAGNNNMFFPITAAQMLKNYANCKEKQDKRTGSFSPMTASISIDKVIGHKYDPDMLEKFTAIMLLLSVEPDGEEEYLMDDKKRKIIEDNKEIIIKNGKLWTAHAELLRLYPEIQDKKIEELISLAMSKLSRGEILQEKPKKGGKGKKPVQTQYDIKLSEQDKEPVKKLFDTILCYNLDGITDGLNGEWSENNMEAVALGAYTFLTSKEIVLNKEIWRHPSVFNDMQQVFRSRYLYILFGAFSHMKVKEVDMKWGEFEKIFARYAGENGDGFVILDTECDIDVMVKMDPLPEGRRWSLRRYYKGAYYYNTGLGTSFNLRDVPLAESFDKTVVLVKFADMPILMPETEEARPAVKLSNDSNKEKGWMAVRVTVDPHLVVKYSKQAEVIRVRLRK